MDYKKLSDAIRLCGSTPKINKCKEKCPYYAGGDMTKCIPVMTKDAADAIIKFGKDAIKYQELIYDLCIDDDGEVLRSIEDVIKLVKEKG